MGITGYVAGFDRRRMRGLLVALALAAAGCTSGGNQAADLMPGGESGYRWVGEGQRGNFASAHSFCRQSVQFQNFGNLGSGMSQRGAGTVTYNMPDVNVTSFPGFPTRSSVANRRSFDGCMRSQGWAAADQTPQPVQPAPPQPSTAAPATQ